MLELHAVPSDVIGCFGRPAALDQIAETAALSVRVAPDELLLLSDSRRISEVEAELGARDGGSLAVELSSGLAIWALRGDDRFEAFSRLSAIKLPAPRLEAGGPPAAVQGLVAHVPAKIVVRSNELLLIVSSVVSHHLRGRVLGACADLAPTETGDARPVASPIKEGVSA